MPTSKKVSVILLRRSSVANSYPTANNLQEGELVMNRADGKLAFKDTNNNIRYIRTDALGPDDVSSVSDTDITSLWNTTAPATAAPSDPA